MNTAAASAYFKNLYNYGYKTIFYSASASFAHIA